MARRRKPSLPALGELEYAVLAYLWREGEADVIETHTAVGARRGITSNTVGSALERLHRKDLVKRRKLSHAYRYRPALSRESFHARRAIEAAGGAGALTERGLLTAFLDLVGEADETALDHLEELIASRRRAKKS